MRVGALVAIVAVAIATTGSGCGEDNVKFCDGCKTPTPTPTVTVSPSPTETVVEEADAAATPALPERTPSAATRQ